MAHKIVVDYSDWEITGSINGFIGKEKQVNPRKYGYTSMVCSDDK